LIICDGMKPYHIALGILTAAIWGFNFVVLKVALRDVPPILLTAVRFSLACLPVLFLARPAGMTAKSTVIVGLCTFLGQYVFLFVAMALGMPAGLSAVTLQLQVFVTILMAALVLGERPSMQQWIGGAIALAGLGLIAATVGQGTSIPALAMVFIVASASIWAVGNVAVKMAGPGAGFGSLAGVAWASLVPIVPALFLSFVFEGPERIAAAWTNLTLLTVAAVLFVVVFSTWAAFAMWGMLLSTYSASAAAPFALLVPVFGFLSGYLVLGEAISLQQLIGALLIVLGLVVIVVRGLGQSISRAPPPAPPR
jgi:O-acetylserine/cysteine efflux transporter